MYVCVCLYTYIYKKFQYKPQKKVSKNVRPQPKISFQREKITRNIRSAVNVKNKNK